MQEINQKSRDEHYLIFTPLSSGPNHMLSETGVWRAFVGAVSGEG